MIDQRKREILEALRTKRGDRSSRSKIPRRTTTDASPLSFAQQRLWLVEKGLAADAPVRPYNESAAYTFEGALDVETLRKSLHALAQRHDILRTTFFEQDDVPAQRVSDENPFADPILFEDLRKLSPAEQSAHLETVAISHNREALLGPTKPALRVRLLGVSETTHVLIVSTHHAITDGWSDNIFLRDLAELYRGFVQDRAPQLQELAIQYADFAIWQRERLSGEQLRSGLAYWTRQLRGAPPSIALPTDKPSRFPTFQGARERVVLDPSVCDALRELARQERSTVFMVLLAALDTLLFRYSSQEDLAIGAVIANREHVDTHDLIGFFANMVVLRADLSGNPSFRDVIRRVREVTLGAQAHQEVPFDKVVAELSASRTDGKNPLFQVGFIFQEKPSRVDILPDLGVDLDFLHSGGSIFDLSLYATETPGGLRCTFEYSTDLFEASTIRRLVDHFRNLTMDAVSQPDCRIGELALLSPDERQQVLVDWNATARDYPADVCIQELFEAQVDRTPDAIAVMAAGETLTYRELDERANRLAHHLRACGAGPGELVGIFLERSVELVIALFAAFKSGAAYVPLDPTYPKDRLSFIQEDARPKVLVTQISLGGRLPDVGARVVRVDADAVEIARSAVSRPTRLTNRTSLSHVIYTSGSTGRPKGIAIEHRVMVNYCEFSREMHPPEELAGVWLFATSVCFDMSLFELLVPLSWGGRVYVVEDLFALATVPADAGITFVNSVPSVLAVFMRDGKLPASVQTVSTAGEALPNALVKQLYAAGVRRVYDLYGPTETFLVTWTIRSGEGTPTIGRPISNTQIYLLDARGQLVPPGARGEIYAGGDGVARGYLNRPELTSQRFIANPFGPGKLYKTGDVARWLPDGTLCYMGRSDHQVKIRGFRIEPGEIEVVLASHPSVREASVLAREDTPGDKRLVAYVVGKVGALEISELRTYLEQRLPAYMVPAAFVMLDALPLTPNGKIDRLALPAPDSSSSEESEYVAPRTPEEELLAGIWEHLLQVDRVGLTDHFFHLGGHSLLGMRLISRIRDVFDIAVPLRSVFETPTLAGQAQKIAAARSKDRLGSTSIEAQPTDGERPLSFAQQRMWFIDQMTNGSSLYNAPVVFRLRGALDVAALEYGLQEIHQRHETLRSTVVSQGGRPAIVISDAPFLLTKVDLRTTADPERAVRDVANDEVARPFDLATELPWRVKLLRSGDDDHTLVVTMHHIVTDGWSMGVLVEDLAALYAAHRDGRPSPLSPLPIQYSDYTRWQTGLTNQVFDGQLAYWKKQLAGIPPVLELPHDHPRPPEMSHRGGQYLFALSSTLSRELEVVSRDQGVTMYMLMLAAFQTLLHRYSRQDDILVGSPIAGRTRHEIEGLIGLFVNTVVMRTNFSENPTFAEVLGNVRDTTLGAYAHQDLPFEKLIDELKPDRSLSHTPLFQVFFQVDAYERPRLPGLTVTAEIPEIRSAKFDLLVGVFSGGEQLRIVFDYARDLFDPPTMVRMADHFERLLEGIVAQPQRRVDELPLLSPEQRQQVLVDWNATARDYSADPCLHELFEAQVDRTPDAIAVVAGGQTLTYRELDERANRLAHHLRACGAGPGELVGIFLERSAELVIALFAALKSGAAYVPLDPTYPKDRLAFIQEDARPKVLVTQTSLGGRLPDIGARIVRVDADAAELARAPSSRPTRLTDRTSLSHVIYTSGSTGRPKGIAIEHRVMVNYCQFSREIHPPDELRSVLFATSVCFDMSLFELFVPLSLGGCATVVENLFSLATLPADAGITFVNAVPSVLAAFLRDNALPPSVETVSCAGEALPNALVKQLYAAGIRRVYDWYGPTETFIVTWTVRSGDGTPTIGRPISNMQIYLLDAHGQLVPPGARGDLYAGGEGLARGYLNRPDLTNERFIPNPFGPGQLYKTGDVARWLPDGTLVYLGRSDHQVKIRGFRIEPGEIEVVLASHPTVREAAVVAREDTPGDKRLVAYVVGKAGAPEISELQAYLAERVPEYMMPAAFVTLEALPQTPNGKIDRLALPAVTDDAYLRDEYVAPRSEDEQALARTWQGLLGIERVGARDNFFQLGGNSMLALQLIARIRRDLGAELRPQDVFSAPTVEQMATRMGRSSDELSQRGSVKRLSLTEGPAGLLQPYWWTINEDDPRKGVPLVVPQAFRLRGPLEPWAIERALPAVAARHEILRTNYEWRGGELRQIVRPAQPPFLPSYQYENWEGRDRGDQERALAEATQESLKRPFDLGHGPVARIKLIRLGPEEHALVRVMHHVALDGPSVALFTHDLAAGYRAALDQPSAEVVNLRDPLPFQFLDVATYLQAYRDSSAGRADIEYWQRRFDGVQPLALPVDFSRDEVDAESRAKQASTGRPYVAHFPYAEAIREGNETLAELVVTAARRASVTPLVYFLAGLGELLHGETGQTDIALQTSLNVRPLLGAESLIGGFNSLIFVRMDLSKRTSHRELLAQVGESFSQAYARALISPVQIVPAHAGRLNVGFVPGLDDEFRIGDAVGTALPISIDSVSPFDLRPDIMLDGRQLFVSFAYNTRLFRHETMERMCGRYLELLRSMAEDPNGQVHGK